MTPKEKFQLLKYLILEAPLDKHNIGELETKCDLYANDIEQALTELESIKRYPTAKEVCGALSKYLKAEVKYIPHPIRKNGFYLVDSGLYLVSLGDDNQVNFSYNNWIKFNQLPPSLIVLIGRFYEGVKKAAEQPK